MPVFTVGSVNPTSSQIPNVNVQVSPPTENALNGVPTTGLGIVGSASWGPVNSPTTIGRFQDLFTTFGPPQARVYDLVTAAWASILNGANNIEAVRVTDGTDTAASVAINTNALTFTSKYTGSAGNTAQVSLAVGSAASSFKVIVTMPNRPVEVFDNLAAGLSGNAVYVAIANAINNGVSGLRGPSNLVVCSAGSATAAPTPVTGVALSGGTDGATSVTTAALVGVDTAPRTGMYALRATGVRTAFIADLSDTTSFAAQMAFGLSEGVYMILAGPSGQSITAAIAVRASAGIDTPTVKALVGDWCYFEDTYNGMVRLISPQGFVAGARASLSPEQSLLNANGGARPLQGIVATQKSATGLSYSDAELLQLQNGGVDVITNPIPAGNMFGLRLGINASSNPVIRDDNYTPLTNYIAYTMEKGMGLYLGKLGSPDIIAKVKSTLQTFLNNLQTQGQISLFSVAMDSSLLASQGTLIANVRVRYLGVIRDLLINLEGGQTVNVTVSPPVSA